MLVRQRKLIKVVFNKPYRVGKYILIPTNSNKTMLKNVITRELLKRKDIRFVKFVKN